MAITIEDVQKIHQVLKPSWQEDIDKSLATGLKPIKNDINELKSMLLEIKNFIDTEYIFLSHQVKNNTNDLVKVKGKLNLTSE